MTKRSSGSNSKTLAGVLSAIFILLVALAADYFLGIDILNPEEEDGDSEQQVVSETVASGEWYSLYFTEPLETSDRTQHTGSAVEAALIESIDGATQTIDAALFELNLASVTEALIRARDRNVTVRLVLDDDHMVLDDESTIDMLREDGMVVYCEDSEERPNNYDIRCDDRGAFMHNKFFIIDSSIVWMGSMNLTHNGVYNNNNNFIRINSSRLATNYQNEFDEMFEDGIFTDRDDPENTPFRRLTINGILVETYFSPEDGELIEERIVELIQGADTSIAMLVNIVTLESIGDAAVDRFNDDVDVRAVFESRGSSQGEMVTLACAGVPVREDGNRAYTFHHKAIVIDGEIVITGSYNFSASARDDNSENVLIIHSPEIAEQYLAEFERRFNDPDAEDPMAEGLSCPN
ncbi:MAG: phospholipase [Chloroflexi bacterium]|nr:phospholipase [Chloroflexota bacterium]